MPDAFFASTSKKRKRSSQPKDTKKAARTVKAAGSTLKNVSKQRKIPRRDEELDSDVTHTDIDDVDLRASSADSAESDKEENAHETPAEKRLRLAKIYLESVKKGLTRGEGEYDAGEIDRDVISARLKEDVLENAGKLHIFIAGTLATEHLPRRLRIKGHRLAVTSAVLSHDAKRLFVAGKEGGLSSWDVASGKRLSYSPKVRSHASRSGGGQSNAKEKGKGKANTYTSGGHTDEVLALALSGDGKYLVSGGKDKIVGVWEVDGTDDADGGSSGGLRWVKGLGGHKDTISALSFRKSTNTLYSASSDRTIKLFDLSPGVMGYVETLFGHQDSITALDSLRGDTAVSCGGRDRTCRFWKIADETQLVFRGGGNSRTWDLLEGMIEGEDDGDLEKSQDLQPKGKGRQHRWVEGSIDCVAMVDETTFVSGGDSGTIALWSTNKKKPIFKYPVAHGLEEIESSTEGTSSRPRWITSIACLLYSDLLASGSWDGSIRLWKLEPSLRSFSPVGSLPVPGLINSLQLALKPKGWSLDDAWGKETTLNDDEAAMATSGTMPSPNGDGKKSAPIPEKERDDEGVLLVAGLGQETRLGRWITMKGEGVVNAAIIFSLRKR